MRIRRPAPVSLYGVSFAAFLVTSAPLAAYDPGYLPAIPAQAWPGDRIFVPLVGGGACNQASPDPAQRPRIRPRSHTLCDNGPDCDVHVYEVSYFLREAEDPICGTPPPPPIFYADVGPLPHGVHVFEMRGELEGKPHREYTSQGTWVKVHEGVPAEVGGLWYAPGQEGRGLHVLRTSAPAMLLLTLFTQDAQGEPTWVLASGAAPWPGNVFSAAALSARGVPFGSGPAPNQITPWGSLEFTYLGCGRAQLRWDADDPVLGNGSIALRKLAQSGTDPICSPPGAVSAHWIRDD